MMGVTWVAEELIGEGGRGVGDERAEGVWSELLAVPAEWIGRMKREET
jgi:hypothetical protein